MNAPTVLFAWRRTPPPLLIGGAEVSQQLLAEEFARAGWTTVYLGSHEAPWDGSDQTTALKEVLGRRQVPVHEADGETRYRWNGVDCITVSQERVPKALMSAVRTLSPELVITSQEGAADLAAYARQHGCRVIAWLHSISTTSFGVLRARPDVALATSEFVASRLTVPPGTRPVVFHPPFRSPAAPKHTGSLGGLLMINPIPAKGSALLHQLIRNLPTERFTLVEGWWNTAEEFTRYRNVRYVARTYDMDALYPAHRLLLVPSQVEDAFPRVIVEAGLHGVPALGSQRGGVPEAIGSDALVLPPDDVDAWLAAIDGVDPAAMGENARAHALRFTRPCLPELAAGGVIPDFEDASPP